MRMTVRRRAVHDWSYREARRRMIRVGRSRLPQHVGLPRMDNHGNRLVDCTCGWHGNGLGWASHLDSVVRSALDAETAR
jgi:hypothetical protein